VYLYKPDGAPELDVSEEEIQAMQAKKEFERKASEAEARPASPASIPGIENLTPEQAKAMREKFEKLPKEQRDAVMQRLRQGGIPGMPGGKQPPGPGKRGAGPPGEGRGGPKPTRKAGPNP